MPARASGFFAPVLAAVARIAESMLLVSRSSAPAWLASAALAAVPITERTSPESASTPISLFMPNCQAFGLLGLHLRVARLALILRRAGRSEDGRGHDRAGAHQHPCSARCALISSN